MYETRPLFGVYLDRHDGGTTSAGFCASGTESVTVEEAGPDQAGTVWFDGATECAGVIAVSGCGEVMFDDEDFGLDHVAVWTADPELPFSLRCKAVEWV